MPRLKLSSVIVALAAASCMGTPSGGGPGLPGPEPEICGDGLDQNLDGQSDEHCTCIAGTTQACFNGNPGQAHKGECRDGVQTCEVVDEFTTWSDCVGAVLPSHDDVGNGVDEDCSGADGPGTDGSGSGSGSGTGSGTGSGGGDCAPAEFGGDCFNGEDEDCDGHTDCSDPDCASEVLCSFCVPEACWDGYDDDCDGVTDCADPDCASSVDCGCMEVCVAGQQRWCDTPTACTWGEQTCNPDGSWGTCYEVPGRPLGCEDSGDFYDPDCCNAAPDECCQDYPSTGSIGECTGITSCS